MIRNQRDKDLQSTKQEGDHKLSAAQASSRLWSGLKNPRIVRVSRAFGGKDRHSKVTTVRGLRDRRVRLSVPTAIQLYDLQDRLGLNQPSKVVDWLLNAAQHEIDKLPPLQMPPDGFSAFSHELVPQPQDPSHANREDPKDQLPFREKGNGVKDDHGLVSPQALSGFSTMPYASYYQWEAANAYLSQLGLRSSQTGDQAPVMSLFCPPGIMPSMFHSNVGTFGQLQMASSASQTPQSNLEINSLHLSSSPSPRPFQ